MSRFPSAKHLAAWAGLAPGNNESAGRRRSSRRGKANPAAAKKAAFAVAHTLIKIIWTVLSTGQPYTDLGPDFYTRRIDTESQKRALIARLEALTGRKITFVDDPGEEPTAA